MALTFKHNFVSPIVDQADPTLLGPDEWNDDHATSMATNKLLGRATAGAGTIEEITLGTNLSYTGTTLNAAGGAARITLSADQTYYFRTTGNDTTGDGSLANPWLTVQHGMDYVVASIDGGGYGVTFDIGTGSFAGIGLKPCLGVIYLFAKGAGVASTTIIDGPGGGSFNTGECFSAYSSLSYFFVYDAMTLASSAYANIGLFAPCHVKAVLDPSGNSPGNIAHVCPGYVALYIAGPGVWYSEASHNTISGNITNYILAQSNCYVQMFSGSLTVTLGQTFTSFIDISEGAVAEILSTFTNPASAVGARYVISSGGGINTAGAGATYLPGDSAGTNDGTGYYV